MMALYELELYLKVVGSNLTTYQSYVMLKYIVLLVPCGVLIPHCNKMSGAMEKL